MASRIKGITIEIGGDTTGLDRALKNVQSTIRNTQSSLRDVNKLLKLDPGNSELLAQKQKLLQDAVGATKEKLDALKQAHEQAKAQLERGELGQDKYDALKREIIATEEELKRLTTEAAKANETLSKIDVAGQKMQDAGDKISGAGQKMLPVTAAVAGIGAVAVKTTADFDAAMSKVAAVSGATGEDFDKLREKAREMGAKTKFSASEAAEAMNYMAMAGWKTEDMLSGVEGIMNLAAASGEELGITSDIVTDALTAFGLSAKDSGHFADILAAASSNANTNVSMMGETFKYCAPIAGALGFSAEDTAQAIGLMANSGIKSTQAGTSLRSIMTNLSGEVKIAGKAIGEMTIATSNSDGSMRSLSDILADCRSAFGKLSESEKAAAAESLVGKNAMSGFLALMNAAPADIEKLSGAIAGCDGAALRMAETMQDNLPGQLTILKSQLEELAISFGDLLMPVIRKIVGVVQGFVDKLNSMDDSTRKVILAVALVAASIGPLLIIIGTIISKVGVAMQAFAALGKGILALSANTQLAGGIFAKLGAAISGISAPVVAVVAVIAILVAAFKHLWDTNENFRNSILATWERIQAAISGFCQGIVDRLNALGFNFTDITQVLGAAWDGFCQLLAPLFDGAFKMIAAVLETVTGVILGVLDVFIGLFTGNWEQAWNGIVGIFSSIWDGVVAYYSAFGEALLNALNVILGWFGTSWQEAWTGICDFFKGIWDGVVSFFTGVWQGIVTAVQLFVLTIASILEAAFNIITLPFQFIWENCKEYIIAAWDAISGAVKTALDAIGGAINIAFTAVSNVVSTIWNAIYGVISQIANAVFNAVSSAFNKVKDVATTVWNAISSVVCTVASAIKNKVVEIFNAFKSTISSIFEAIRNVAHNVWEGIKNAICGPIEAARNTIHNIISQIQGFFSGLRLQLPQIKMPHFSIKGSFSLAPPSVPRLSIDWYKEGGIMDGPTLFGLNGTSLMAGGEAGKEAILPLKGFYDKLESMLDSSSANAVIEHYLSIIAANSEKGVYLDDGTLVGRLAPALNRSLGMDHFKVARGMR